MAVVAPDPPVTFAQPVDPSADCCHWMVPVFPVKDKVVVPPEQTVEAAAEAVPATEIGETVTVSVEEVAEVHAPLVTRAR